MRSIAVTGPDEYALVAATPDLDNKEVEHFTVPAMSSIGSNTYSIIKEVVPPMATTTEIDPKAGMQELDDPAVTPSLPIVLCNNIEDILVHVLPEKESQLDDLQWHPWPPFTQV